MANHMRVALAYTRAFFPPSPWEGLGEGAKLDRQALSPAPLPKGEGEKLLFITLNSEVDKTSDGNRTRRN